MQKRKREENASPFHKVRRFHSTKKCFYPNELDSVNFLLLTLLFLQKYEFKELFYPFNAVFYHDKSFGTV